MNQPTLRVNAQKPMDFQIQPDNKGYLAKQGLGEPVLYQELWIHCSVLYPKSAQILTQGTLGAPIGQTAMLVVVVPGPTACQAQGVDG